MAKTIYRVMGKRGRITIPYEFRQQVGFGCNDILSFTRQEDGSVLVKRERICDECRSYPRESSRQDAAIMELLDGLTPAQQRTALLHLSFQLQDDTGGYRSGRNGGEHK